MFIAQAHSFTQQARLAITLAWIAGYTNIVSILTCGWATSHTSGTASQIGRDVAEGSWMVGVFALFLLGTFLVGAALSAVATETGRRRGWDSIYVLPMLMQAILLALFAVGVELHDPENPALIPVGASLWWMTGVASMAMGLQNATITRISGGVVRTTHVTGVVTDLGMEGVQFLFWLRDRRRDSPPLPAQALLRSVRSHPTAIRLALLASILGSFIIGACLGTIALEHVARWAMIPPVLFLLWIVLQDIRTPICEIDSSAEFGGDSGIPLPDAIAVHHLRKDRSRRGAVHRLPDLQTWFDRLPRSKRIVILDLGDVTELDANAILELRALMLRARASERRLVIAGITGEQYHTMRESGAGDVLDPTNLCADLELAIARGMMLLEP